MTGASSNGRAAVVRPVDILVVDDDAQSRALLKRILEAQGHSCQLAGDANEARRDLSRREVDLVLSDVRMPGGSGIELLAYIRAQFPFLPVVMISGIGEIDVATAALELGAYGWVSKPFDTTQILIAVANALIRAGLEEESLAHAERLETAVIERTLELEQAVVKLELSEAEMRRVTEDTIGALTRAIERRDIETAHHIERVSRYATMLATALDLPEERCEMIRAASPMHDVGKIGIPDGILLKPGRVTNAEFNVIKQHVRLGHSILSLSQQPLLQLAAEIAQTHHERWDGTGYLIGLGGEQIPLEGRITAIADTFDALVSRRVYKPPIPLEEAFEVIEAGGGTQFDPELADLFLQHRDEAEAIFYEYPDT
jgi:putative two-component system response regulator